MLYQLADACISRKRMFFVCFSVIYPSKPVLTTPLGNVPPLFHCFDKCLLLSVHLVRPDIIPTRLVLGNLAAWSHGACVVYPSEVFDPKAIVDSVVTEKCTALHGVPTHFLGVLSEVDKRQKAGETLDLSRLRYVIE